MEESHPSGMFISQNTADTRAQRGNTMFASGLVPRPRPAACSNWEGGGGEGGLGDAPPEILEFLSFITGF